MNRRRFFGLIAAAIAGRRALAAPSPEETFASSCASAIDKIMLRHYRSKDAWQLINEMEASGEIRFPPPPYFPGRVYHVAADAFQHSQWTGVFGRGV